MKKQKSTIMDEIVFNLCIMLYDTKDWDFNLDENNKIMIFFNEANFKTIKVPYSILIKLYKFNINNENFINEIKTLLEVNNDN